MKLEALEGPLQAAEVEPVLSFITALSREASIPLQEASVAALFELAADKAVSDKVIEAGGLKLLIKTMKKGTPTARALAAGTLGKLAIDIDLLVKIASQGNIPPLVRYEARGTKFLVHYSAFTFFIMLW